LIVIIVDFKVMMNKLKVLNWPAVYRNGTKMGACQVTKSVNFVAKFVKQRAYGVEMRGERFGKQGDSVGIAGVAVTSVLSRYKVLYLEISPVLYHLFPAIKLYLEISLYFWHLFPGIESELTLC